MNTKKQWQEWVDECEVSESYLVESAKLNFAIALEKQRKSAGISYADLAKLVSTSAAYISKVFRGDSNLTIESMVKLARASGGELKIEIANKKAAESHVDWSNVIIFQAPRPKGRITGNVSSYLFTDAESCNGSPYFKELQTGT